MFQREFKQLENLNQPGVSATEALSKITDLLTKEILSLLRLIPIVYQFLALAFRNKYVQKALKKYINRYLDILIPIIQSGIDSGEFRPVNAREVAIAMGAMIEGTLLLWVYDKSIVEPEYHIRSGMQLLLEGVQAPPS
jgi:hypothetical protein